MAEFCGSGGGTLVNVIHDVLELVVHRFKRPALHAGILRHFKLADRHAASVGCLGRAVGDAGRNKGMHCVKRRGHVCTFRHATAAVGQQGFRVREVQFVLRRAGKSRKAGHVPHGIAPGGIGRHRCVLGGRNQLRIAGEGAALNFFHLLEHVQPDALRVIDHAARVGNGHGFCAHLNELLAAVNSHVARAGNRADLAFKALAARIEHGLGKIHSAVAGGFRPRQRTAKEQVFAGEHALVAPGQALVLPKKKADFLTAHANIASRHVNGCANMRPEFRHECLTEPHDFRLGFTLGVEIRAALGPADGKARERVLENLLKTKKFQHALIHAGVKAQAALERAESRVVLNPITPVNLNLPGVVHPLHAEGDAAFRLHNPLKDFHFCVFSLLVQDGLQTLQHLLHCLQKNRFMGIGFFKVI